MSELLFFNKLMWSMWNLIIILFAISLIVLLIYLLICVHDIFNRKKLNKKEEYLKSIGFTKYYNDNGLWYYKRNFEYVYKFKLQDISYKELKEMFK